MAKKPPLTIKAPERPAPAARAPQPIYELSTRSLDSAPTSAVLPPEADALSDPLRELAVRFIGARRRVGEALLEACRYMSEARAVAEEGQWYLFLNVTGTSPDSAESLINIHFRARQHPAFAEKIRSGQISQTVAGELARPSTPPEVLDQLVSREEPLRVIDVKRARRSPPIDRDERHIVDNPNNPGSAGGLGAPEPPVEVIDQMGQITLEAVLDEIAASMEAVAAQAHALAPDERTGRALVRIERALAAIRRRMPHEG